jgi:SAM-dependent methyltransferase
VTKNKLDSRAIGLDVGLQAAKFLTGKENLHYGLWTGFDVNAANLGAAQEAYTAKLFKLLPKGKLRILDIGGGAGETAKKLVALGHAVDIVIPSAFLAGRCRENGGPTVNVHECMFEDFASDKQFDVCLFSESFQYIPLEIALTKAAGFLAKNGVIVIADCFRTDSYTSQSKDAAVGGGHRYSLYQKMVADLGYKVLSEEEVTQAVAPSVDVEQAFFNVIGYGVSRVDAELEASKPRLRWIAHRIFGMIFNERRRHRLGQRFFQKTRSAEVFTKYNQYFMIKLQP